MTRLVSPGFVLAAGLLVGPGAANPEASVIDPLPREDPRVLRLRGFFQDLKAPVHVNAQDFLAAADRHNLDWRLLPSIATIESTGGKACRNNNIFGWADGQSNFATVRDGIDLVAFRLANSRLYRDKSVDEILETYNPYPDYPSRVRAVMRMIAPDHAPALN